MAKLWLFESRRPGGKWRYSRFNGLIQGATTQAVVWQRLEWLLDNRPGYEHRAAPHMRVPFDRKKRP